MQDALLLDLVEWIAKAPRRYAEVMEAWRTSCPRLPIWESAIEQDLVQRKRLDSGEVMIVITEPGRAFLRQHGRAAAGRACTPAAVTVTGGRWRAHSAAARR